MFGYIGSLNKQIVVFFLEKAFGKFLDVSVENIDVQLSRGHLIVKDARINTDVHRLILLIKLINGQLQNSL